MFYECYIRVIEHSSVIVRLMVINILRRKLCHPSECTMNTMNTMNTSDNVQRVFTEHKTT